MQFSLLRIASMNSSLRDTRFEIKILLCTSIFTITNRNSQNNCQFCFFFYIVNNIFHSIIYFIIYGLLYLFFKKLTMTFEGINLSCRQTSHGARATSCYLIPRPYVTWWGFFWKWILDSVLVFVSACICAASKWYTFVTLNLRH